MPSLPLIGQTLTEPYYLSDSSYFPAGTVISKGQAAMAKIDAMETYNAVVSGGTVSYAANIAYTPSNGAW